jgi:lactoylglutathione lyase
MAAADNVKEVVPFLCVASMELSLLFYREGLGFQMRNQWVVDGKIRWCRLERGGAAIMLQEFAAREPSGKIGDGLSLWFICVDAPAIYEECRSRGLAASEPQVGNGMWVTTLSDPDGYVIHFESVTDVAEDTRLSEHRPESQ